MKVYYLPNSDGVHGALVAAENQKVACKLLNSSINMFRAYGGHATTRPELVELAMSEPGAVWQRKIGYGPKEHPWVKLWDANRKYVGGRG